jgi:hypothetical protein
MTWAIAILGILVAIAVRSRRRQPAVIDGWNTRRAEELTEQTARMLLGSCGKKRIVGSRRDEAVIREREQRLAEMRRRDMRQKAGRA